MKLVRTKEEIMEQAVSGVEKLLATHSINNPHDGARNILLSVILEVLLDIRDVLNK